MVGFLWKKVANLPFWKRAALKLAVFCTVLLIVLYPNPVLLVKQIDRYLDMDSLIQTDFAEIETINREIDAELPADAPPQKEFLAIQHYVYQHIRYEYDWDNWGNIDFWPTAEQVWERKREDCDGRAVLAVSILRSRGFKTATLVGNIRHIWVNVEQQELMGPDKEQNIRRQGGKTIITFPSFDLIFGSTAIYIADFPAIRNFILLFTILGLCYHPCNNLTRFLALITLGVLGFLLLEGWAQEMIAHHAVRVNGNFIGGGGLLGLSLILAMLCKEDKLRQETMKLNV